jgi:hypothetical protein
MIRALLIVGAAAAAAYFYRSRRAAPAREPWPFRPAEEVAGVVPNDVLVERVRAQLGGLVARPEALDVHASAGLVTLGGTLTKAERDRVLREVLAIPGVVRVLNQTEVSDEMPLSPGSSAAG